jgi:zinc transporter ZupT
LFTEQYPPMPGVIMMASMFCLFMIEMYLNGKMGGHSHGGPMGFETHSQPPATTTAANRGPPPERPPRYSTASDFEIEEVEYEKKLAQKMYEERLKDYRPESPSEMPPWFVVFYEQYVRQRLEMINMIKSMRVQQQQQQQHQAVASDKRQTVIAETPIADSPYIDEETGLAVAPDVYRKMSLNITLLEGGILFHSVFVGMTVSITIEGFVVLLIAILFHQMFEGLGLGSRIAAVPYPRGSLRPWLLVVAFGTTAPIGQAIGLIARNSYDPNSAFGLIIVGVFNAM